TLWAGLCNLKASGNANCERCFGQVALTTGTPFWKIIPAGMGYRSSPTPATWNPFRARRGGWNDFAVMLLISAYKRYRTPLATGTMGMTSPTSSRFAAQECMHPDLILRS